MCKEIDRCPKAMNCCKATDGSLCDFKPELPERPQTEQAEASSLSDLLCCPFCGEVPPLPNGDGTQYEIWCDCGMAMSTVQISDLMTIDERMESDDFMETHRYGEEYIERAKAEAVRNWNNRAI